MRRLRGVLAGYLGLTVLYALSQTRRAERISGLAGVVSGLVDRALSPKVAGVPDRVARAGDRGGGTWLTAPAAAAPIPPAGQLSTVRGGV
jgi:hypothetical protein